MRMKQAASLRILKILSVFMEFLKGTYRFYGVLWDFLFLFTREGISCDIAKPVDMVLMGFSYFLVEEIITTGLSLIN